MTAKKAIIILESIQPSCGEKYSFSESEIYEAIDMAIEALNHSEIPNSSDCIDRAEAQTAIQFAARRYTVAHEAHGAGKVVWSDNLISVTDAMNALREVPSAQPEIVRCKDCVHFSFCQRYGCKEDDFCSFAERRTDADMRGEQDE